MRATDDLFILIKSMTGAEKRYFQLFSSIYERDKNYLKLFEALDKQKKKYNEQKLLQDIKGEKWLSQLPKTKNQLYAAILNSLEIYHRNSDVRTQLSSSLDQIKILFEKKLYGQSKKLVLKAKKIAKEYEYNWELTKLQEWELIIIQRQLYINISKAEMKLMLDQLFDSIKKMENEYEYTRVSMNFFINVIKGGSVRDSAEMKKHEKSFNQGIMKNESDARSFHAAHLFFNLKATFHFYSNDFNAADHYRGEILNLYEKDPHQIAENIDKYSGNLLNKAAILINLKKYDEVLAILQKLRDANICSDIKRQNIYIQSRIFELETYIAIGDFNSGLNIAKEFENGLEKIDELLDKRLRINIRADIAMVYFGLNEFAQANTWLNKIINGFKDDVKPDLLCITRIIQLIVHFEMNDNDQLEYSVRSTYRYLLKHKRLYKFEDAVLAFIRNKMPHIDTNKRLIIAFKEFKIEIEKIFKDPYEKKALVYFDFISWLESKIDGRLFAVVLKQKAMNIRH